VEVERDLEYHETMSMSCVHYLDLLFCENRDKNKQFLEREVRERADERGGMRLVQTYDPKLRKEHYFRTAAPYISTGGIGHNFNYEYDPDLTPERVPADAFEHLLEEFCNGDVMEILRECRHENNEKYDEDTIAELVRALDEDGKTINAPFCFTKGAMALKWSLHNEAWTSLHVECVWESAFTGAYLDTRLGFGECEIGVYISRAGGDIAEWHRDGGDNATIQLTGRKQWEFACAMFDDDAWGLHVKERLGAVHSAARIDTPTCGADYMQYLREDYLREQTITYVVEAGDSICVPRGHWHRVTPLGDETSISVDIRISRVESGAWCAEQTYLRSFVRACIHPSDSLFSAEPLQIEPIAWLPFEPEFSSGLVLGARLKYIVHQLDKVRGPPDSLFVHLPRDGFSDTNDPFRREACGVYFNPVCACSLSVSGNYNILNIKASSALTKKDFMSEFNIYVDRSPVLDRYLKFMFSRGPVSFARLECECELAGSYRDRCETTLFPEDGQYTRTFKRDWNEMRIGGKVPPEIFDLRNILLDANILLPDKTHHVKNFWLCVEKYSKMPHGDSLYHFNAGPDEMGVRRALIDLHVPRVTLR
jgi:hypothetical protein